MSTILKNTLTNYTSFECKEQIHEVSFWVIDIISNIKNF